MNWKSAIELGSSDPVEDSNRGRVNHDHLQEPSKHTLLLLATVNDRGNAEDVITTTNMHRLLAQW